MNHILIITGGLLDFDFAKEYIKTLSFDKVFAVDKGLEYVERLGLLPDYIVGDFDTVNPKILKAYEEKIQKGESHAFIDYHPAKKDATDTEIALDRAINEEPDCITILAATGDRIDHVLMNLSILMQPLSAGIDCVIVDRKNKIQLLSDKRKNYLEIKNKEQYGKYLSLIPMTSKVEALTITGVMYPLTDKDVYQGSSLTVSNQIIDDIATIHFKSGTMLVIESKDE